MRALVTGLLLLGACSVSDAPAQVEPAPITLPPQSTENAATTPAQTAPPVIPAELSLDCAGAFTQGGLVVCRTLPGAELLVDGVSMGRANAEGWGVIGFMREHGAQARISARSGEGLVAQQHAIAPRTFDVQRVDGLPQQTVTPTEPAVLARIQRDTALKNEGFASQAALTGFLDGFIWPVEGGRISGRWGNQRVLNGTPATPHFGVDIAVPTGTPIRAPAAGVVSLANPDMHFEGGLVFIDHGQGLITMYLHMSRLDVVAGQRVEQGQIIGAVGATGRATGPHLCWRMRLNGRQLDPTVAIDGLQAARASLLR